MKNYSLFKRQFYSSAHMARNPGVEQTQFKSLRLLPLGDELAETCKKSTKRDDSAPYNSRDLTRVDTVTSGLSQA